MQTTNSSVVTKKSCTVVMIAKVVQKMDFGHTLKWCFACTSNSVGNLQYQVVKN